MIGPNPMGIRVFSAGSRYSLGKMYNPASRIEFGKPVVAQTAGDRLVGQRTQENGYLLGQSGGKINQKAMSVVRRHKAPDNYPVGIQLR